MVEYKKNKEKNCMGITQCKNIYILLTTQPSRSGVGIESKQNMGYGNGGKIWNWTDLGDSGQHSQSR